MPTILLLVATVLTACSLQQDIKEEDVRTETGVVQETQTPLHPVIVERLLPTGLLEIGDRDAPVTLLMYTEHHCRYCKEFLEGHFPKLKRDFIDPGILKLQIGILPLRKYPFSINAGMGLLCAARQGKGIPMHRLLFELGAKTEESLLAQANTVGLDTELFLQCLRSTEEKTLFEHQTSLARSLDVTLVPTFFLDGEKSVGLPHYPDLRGTIEALLSE